MNQITNNRPETFAELRQMIAQAKKIYVQAWINDGMDNVAGVNISTYENLEVTKTYAYSVYQGGRGEYKAYDNEAYYDWDNKIFYLN